MEVVSNSVFGRSPEPLSKEEVVMVGRICCDAEAKLNEAASILLESSLMMGSGARVPLKFDTNLKVVGGPVGQGGFGLFPGQIVALRGKNGSGASFLVTSVLSVRLILPRPSTPCPPRNSSQLYLLHPNLRISALL